MIDKVDGNRIGSDVNCYAISALKSIRSCLNELPKNNKEFTEEQYTELTLNEDYLHKGYAGFAFSYGAKWLGGWRRDKARKRDYVAEAYRNAEKQSPNLQGIGLRCCSYDELSIPPKNIIYCDIPYAETTKYKHDFDHDKFWDWVRQKESEGHSVFVSEYNAPDDFEVLWQKKVNNSLTKDTGSKQGIEKLFRLKRSIQ